MVENFPVWTHTRETVSLRRTRPVVNPSRIPLQENIENWKTEKKIGNNFLLPKNYPKTMYIDKLLKGVTVDFEGHLLIVFSTIHVFCTIHGPDLSRHLAKSFTDSSTVIESLKWSQLLGLTPLNYLYKKQ